VVADETEMAAVRNRCSLSSSRAHSSQHCHKRSRPHCRCPEGVEAEVAVIAVEIAPSAGDTRGTEENQT
jgi:hypothetical protein